MQYGNTVMEDRGSVAIPSVNELNKKNTSTTNGSGSFNIPSLQVYQPDYGALQSSLNDILKSFDMYKQSAQSSFDAGKSGLDLNLEQSLRSIGDTRESNKEEFTKGRQQVSEDIYSATRANQAQMSARGLAGSGIEAMANLQTRMQAGETVSDMAGEFFDAQGKLVQAEVDAREQYNVQLQNLNSSLQSAMAQIMNQEASTKMGYTQMVENLKRQVVMDTNAVRESQSNWQMTKSQLDQAGQITNSMVQQTLESDTSDEFKLSALKDFGYTDSQARAMVAQQSVATNANTKKAQGQQLATIQNQINALVNQSGYSEAEIEQYIAQLITNGVDVDWTKLNTTGGELTTKPKTSLNSNSVGKNTTFGVSGKDYGNTKLYSTPSGENKSYADLMAEIDKLQGR